jgi:hypothetical protein
LVQRVFFTIYRLPSCGGEKQDEKREGERFGVSTKETASKATLFHLSGLM